MVNTDSQTETYELQKELEQNITGEVRFDQMSKTIYSTDASIYQIAPIGVVLPRSRDDVVAIIETARKHGCSVLPRGAGTSLAGQTVGQSLVIDFSKYMNKVIELNQEEEWVRVQPGIVLDELNHHLRPFNVLFAPDPSTSNRGNVGGAIGNNSCGSHSVKWGKTIDHTLELDTVLTNGETHLFKHTSRSKLNDYTTGNNFLSEIYQNILQIGTINAEEVKKQFPKIMRRVSGYNLDEIKPGSDFNMARFLVGSEGTLLTITEAKMKVVPIPQNKILAVIHFHELSQALEATVITLEHCPDAVELVGSMIIRQAQSNISYARMMDFVEGKPEALLLVEMSGTSELDVRHKMDELKTTIDQSRLSYSFLQIENVKDQERVWAVRKAGLGLMMNVKGPAKPLPFVEDTAVAPEKLPEFVRRFDQIVKDNGTSAGYYGHASVGCLHIRPLIDLTNKEGVQRMESIAEDISDLVLEFGGSLSGEHGDGLVRSNFIEKMFGPVLYKAFQDVKKTFDPQKMMNPGKIIESSPMVKNLRIQPDQKSIITDTKLNFEIEGGFKAATEMCNGQGACRKVLNGTMCPSYMVTRDEEHSTRGRANALRAAASGSISPDSFTSKRLYDILDLCFECKACTAECPSNVNMTKLKYEFLDTYYRENGQNLRNIMFGNISTISKLGTFFAPLSNWIINTRTSKEIFESQGIDSRRTLPKFSNQSLTQWFKARGGSRMATPIRGQIVLFPDTFTNFNYPHIGKAAVKVIEHLGYEILMPSVKCCGRPMLSAGMIDKAKSNAQFNIKTLLGYIRNGAKIVGIEPSCILSFRDDYKDLTSDISDLSEISDNTMLIDEFLTYAQEVDGATLNLSQLPSEILLHSHCQQKALSGTKQSMDLLGSIPKCNIKEIDSGCCGMAGSFGYKSEHYDISMKAGERSLFPTIRASDQDAIVVSDGTSCRQQIQDGTGVKAIHIVELIADLI